MARQMDWKELEQRMAHSSVIWEAGMGSKPEQKSVVPVYVVYTPPPTPTRTREPSIAKMAAIFGGIVLAGLMLGLAMAQWLL